jgi:hypothetical protein
MKDSRVAREWLRASARTANEKDYAAHMNLISRKVRAFGVPGIEVIGYDDRARQCKHEFETGVFKNVSYSGMKVQVMTPGRVMFKTVETVEANDGAVQAHGRSSWNGKRTATGAWCRSACSPGKKPNTTACGSNRTPSGDERMVAECHGGAIRGWARRKSPARLPA